MPNQIDQYGLQVNSLTEIISNLDVGMQAIYGADINIDADSPDSQMINLFAQTIIDMLELLVSLNSTFDPDNCYGTYCDSRFALNGIQRHQGSYSIQYVSITVSGALTLAGLDGSVTPTGAEFVVSDNAGAQWILQSTQSPSVAGTYSYAFRAYDIGQVESLQNTITNQVTITSGVVAVNNPLTITTLGSNEETDSQFKIRRANSFMLPAIGVADTIQAQILQLTGVTDCVVYENNTTSSGGDIPAHGIWAVVENGTPSEIASVIYTAKNAGTAMAGSETYVITRPAGNSFTAQWDWALYDNLRIKFNVTPRIAGLIFDTDDFKNELVATLSYKLNQTSSIGDIIIAMSSIEPNTILSDVFVSNNGSDWGSILAPSDRQHKFSLSATNIAIVVLS